MRWSSRISFVGRRAERGVERSIRLSFGVVFGPIYFKTSATPEIMRARLTSLWNCISVNFWNTRSPSHAPARPGSAYTMSSALNTARSLAKLNATSVTTCRMRM